MAGKIRHFAHSISSPDCWFADPEVQIAELSGLDGEYSRFAETFAGD
jgi:hypothetical protein